MCNHRVWVRTGRTTTTTTYRMIIVCAISPDGSPCRRDLLKGFEFLLGRARGRGSACRGTAPPSPLHLQPPPPPSSSSPPPPRPISNSVMQPDDACAMQHRGPASSAVPNLEDNQPSRFTTLLCSLLRWLSSSGSFLSRFRKTK